MLVKRSEFLETMKQKKNYVFAGKNWTNIIDAVLDLPIILPRTVFLTKNVTMALLFLTFCLQFSDSVNPKLGRCSYGTRIFRSIF